MNEAVRAWVSYAERDLKAARRLLEGEPDTMNAAFHAQQAVEKMLKAILQSAGPDPAPRTHDLEQLARATEVWKERAQPDQVRLQELTACVLLMRYPDVAHGRSLAPQEAEEYVAWAEVFCAWLSQRLT